MAKNWEYAAGLLWPVLIRAAKKRQTLHYEDLAPRIDTNSRNVGKGLGPILYYCRDSDLPPLTSIVVNKWTRKPGQGFNVWNRDRIGEAHEQVYRFDWRNLENPFGGLDKSDTTETLATKLVQNPDSVDEIYKKVKVRGIAQIVFRKALLNAYDHRCAICGLGFDEALDAAHIIPWNDSDESLRISPRNGILLCANHHRLFDRNWIDISDEFEILYAGKRTSRKRCSDADLAATVNLHGKSLRLPERGNLRPSRKLLRKRREDN